MMRTRILIVAFLVIACFAATPSFSQDASAEKPDPRFFHDPGILELDAPILRWDEAIPLGNGTMGGLLWGGVIGGKNIVYLSLDRVDLWDIRLPPEYLEPGWTYQTLQELVAKGDQDEIVRRFDTPYEKYPYPTHLPPARLEIELAPSMTPVKFQLDFKRGEGRVLCADGGQVNVAFSMTSNVVVPLAVIQVKGVPLSGDSVRITRSAALDRLGYPAATADSVVSGGVFQNRIDQKCTWEGMEKPEEALHYVVATSHITDPAGTFMLATITTSLDLPNPTEDAWSGLRSALPSGYDELLQEHIFEYTSLWVGAAVKVPDAAIQRQCDFARYLYAAGSAPNALPMALQGVWTADDGNLPPWKNDYHNDLNTQMCYLAYHTAGLPRQGQSLTYFLQDRADYFRGVTRAFYGVDGLIVPGVMTSFGQPTAGWSQYALSPTNSAWLAQTFYLHSRYTMDGAFFQNEAYPWCASVGIAIRGLLKPTPEGKLRLPLSSSPEFFDNSLKAWLEPNSNYDTALLQSLFSWLLEMSRRLSRPADEVQGWLDTLTALEPLATDADTGALLVARGVPYDQSHRHFSHAMAIHPLGLMSIEGGEEQRRTVLATIDQIESRGTSEWVGYSFSWFSAMCARAGLGDKALDYLQKYCRGFISRNGFHVNGDQSGTGLSSFTYRPFTLEGNFLAMQAVHEMLLQSWGGVVRVFPAVPQAWPDVSFDRLMAEGAFKVSATRSGGRTTMVKIRASEDGVLKLRDPAPGSEARWALLPGEAAPVVERKGPDYFIKMKKGEVLEWSPSQEDR